MKGAASSARVGVEGVLAVQAVGGIGPFVVPGFLIDRVDADHLQFSALYLWAKSADHSAVFVLEKAASGRGKNNHGETAVPERQEFHIAMQ